VRNTFFEQIGDCVVVLKMQNRVVDMNPAAERLAGYPGSEALGLPVKQIWTNWPSRLILSDPASPEVMELTLTPAGEPTTYILNPHTITDQKNHPLNKLVLLIDITKRKTLEKQLEDHSYFWCPVWRTKKTLFFFPLTKITVICISIKPTLML
jgi:PAS domain S-box-containing protein